MPNVTCVMPTRQSRQHFWHSAVCCFLNQTIEDAELLILDESPARALGEWPERVRYVWMPEQNLSTGQKRNRINDLVETDIIMHHDDDDWFHPLRIADQVAHLFTSKKQVVGYHDCMYLRLPQRDLWKYRFPGVGPYATGTSLCYYKTWWSDHRFANKSIGEDSEFWECTVNAGELASKTCDGMIVARSHPDGTFHPDFGHDPFLQAKREEFPEEFLREAAL